MKFMNECDIDFAVQRHANHPVLSKATDFLYKFKEEVNAHSDGWPYWSAPVRAAAKLITLIQSGDASEKQFTDALSVIKSFYTRRGYKAGMTFPTISDLMVGD